MSEEFNIVLIDRKGFIKKVNAIIKDDYPEYIFTISVRLFTPKANDLSVRLKGPSIGKMDFSYIETKDGQHFYREIEE